MSNSVCRSDSSCDKMVSQRMHGDVRASSGRLRRNKTRKEGLAGRDRNKTLLPIGMKMGRSWPAERS